MATDLSAWIGKRSPPSPDEVDELLAKISSLLTELKKKGEAGNAGVNECLKLVETKFNELKPKITKDGKLDREAWQAKGEEERQKTGDSLEGFFDELICLNRDELRIGKCYFFVFFALLLAFILIYAVLHRFPRPGTVQAVLISDVSKDLRGIDLEIKALTKAKSDGKQLNVEELKKSIAALRGKLQNVDLDFPALQLLGTVQAEAERGELTEIAESFAKLSRVLSAELESLRAAFLWNDRRGRWFEIAWWAEIGVLVGILFYIAGTLSRGTFARTDIAMFWTEAAIAPVVVLVIFFLFTLTGITGISPAETSIKGNAGFAFIFGFAIRRTLGLLDIIKKRIFPEPEPGA